MTTISYITEKLHLYGAVDVKERSIDVVIHTLDLDLTLRRLNEDDLILSETNPTLLINEDNTVIHAIYDITDLLPISVKSVTKTSTYRQGSKLNKAQALFNTHKETHTRKQLICMFMEELHMSMTGASTFFQNVKDEDGAKKTVSKKERAIALYQNNPNLRRKEVISLYMDDLFMTEQGASTYYQKIKKELSSKV